MDQNLRNTISNAIRSGDLSQVQSLFTDYPDAIQYERSASPWVVTAIHSVTAARGTGILSLLCQLGCELNPHDAVLSPLCMAISAGNIELTQFLLERGANPNLSPAVIYAVNCANPRNALSLLKLLRQHGADFNKNFSVGNTALKITVLSTAKGTKKEELVKYLQSEGALMPEQPLAREASAPIRKPGGRKLFSVWNSIVRFLTGRKAMTLDRRLPSTHQALSHPFDKIYQLLIHEIPKVIGSYSYPDPLCIVRVNYYDTHAPCTYLDFQCVSVVHRQQTLDTNRNKPAGPLFYLWAPGQECGTRLRSTLPEDPTAISTSGATRAPHNAQIQDLFAEVYDLLDKDSVYYMMQFRHTLQFVTRTLNDLDWGNVCRVSEDFVIAPADGSRFFADDEDDLNKGVPAERLALLQSRGFLGPSDHRLKL